MHCCHGFLDGPYSENSFRDSPRAHNKTWPAVCLDMAACLNYELAGCLKNCQYLLTEEQCSLS